MTNTSEIKNAFYKHYKEIFSQENKSTTEKLEINVNKRLSIPNQSGLTSPITEEEIFTTLKFTQSKKTPGPDGLTYEFYIEYFEILKVDLKRLFNNILSGNHVPGKEFSQGIITLIPKKNMPEDLNDFRPITLLNTDYKLFTKILAMRLKGVLNDIIGKEQKCGIEGASIIDNLQKIRNIILNSSMDRTCNKL